MLVMRSNVFPASDGSSSPNRNPSPSSSAPGARKLFASFLATFLASLFPSQVELQAAPTNQIKGGDGIVYNNDRIESVPWSVHIVKIALNDPTLEVRSTLARGTVLELSTVSDQALAIPASTGTPLAGVNGDFYERGHSTYAGDPRGLQIVEGDLVSAPANAPGYCAFWIDAAGVPHIGDVASQFKVTLPNGQSFPFGLNEARGPDDVVLYTPTLGRSTKTVGGREFILERVNQGSWIPFGVSQSYTLKIRAVAETGNTLLENTILVLSFGPRLATNLPPLEPGTMLELSTATVPDLREARTAIGGGSIITRGGKAARIEKPTGGRSPNFYAVSSMFQRHPRAAVGWNKTHLYLAEVDGRQRRLSVGMTLQELGEYMAKIGCEEAINLDGGGSATFWYRGRVVNSPCDGTERAVANGLIAVRKAVKR
jgi:hypothetical protein